MRRKTYWLDFESERTFYLLNETAPEAQVSILSEKSTALYLHVDDGCVIREAMHDCADALEQIGFEVSGKSTSACRAARVRRRLAFQARLTGWIRFEMCATGR